MTGRLQKFGVFAGVIAFVGCFAGGVCLLAVGEDLYSDGIGIYFLGKAFFVGPMLILTAMGKGEKAR